MININPIFDTSTPWECYRSPTNNLVYFIHNKCASTLYDLLFLKLNWISSNTQQIDWDKDIVFSHFRNPLIKHRKGIVEGVCNFFPEALTLANTQAGIKFLANITSVEAHSYTIYRMLGEKALNVVWIPIDTKLDHKVATFELLKQHGEIISAEIINWFNNLKKENVSTPSELKLFNSLMSVPTPQEIIRHIDFDKCLYEAITTPEGFEPENYANRVQELKLTGLSELEAQAVADDEVKTGKYLNWPHNKKDANC
jgi:hypothetical protein